MFADQVLETTKVNTSETIDVTQTSEVSGASKSKRAALPYFCPS